MRILVIGDVRYPQVDLRTLWSVLEQEKRCDLLVLLGDLFHHFHREEKTRISEVVTVLSKVVRFGRRLGAEKVIYVVGARDDGVLRYRYRILRELGGRALSIEITDLKVLRYRDLTLVFEHGHRQFNVIFSEYYRRYSDLRDAVVAAARRARELEERERRVPVKSWWFIGHTQLLYLDREYRIVHCGSLVEELSYEGTGTPLHLYLPEEWRGYVVLEERNLYLRNLRGATVQYHELQP